MEITTKQKHQLKKFLKELKPYRRRGTELVTVYVPAGYDMNKIINHLSQEQGTATNIKSSTTRKNVIDALERMIQHLRLYKRTPEHGLAAFSGNISDREGWSDVQVWSIEPPIPLNTRIYRCDKSFQLDLLEAMLDTKEVYGLVVMDRREGNIALLKGKTIIPIQKSTSNVPGKTRAGGQSAQRFERLREGAAKEFYNRIGEHMKEQFLHNNQDVKGIIVGGPGPTKYDFVEGDFITDQVKKKIIGIRDLSYTGDFGFQELVDKSQDLLAKAEIAFEKGIMNQFFKHLSTDAAMTTYGKDDVMKKIKLGAVDTLLLSESLSDEDIELYEKEADLMGTTVVLISTETREGTQLKEMGGFAGILRYKA